MLIFGYSFGSALRPVVSQRHCVVLLLGLCLLLGYRYDYAIHGSPYTSAHVLIIEKYISTAQNGPELMHGLVLPESSV